MSRRGSALSLLALVVLAWPVAAVGQVVRRGGEFQVNTYTTGYQFEPGLAMDAAGNFVVVWTDTFQSGHSGIFARRFDAAGHPLGTGEIHVDGGTGEEQAYPVVASDPKGNFVVVWQSLQDEATAGVFARRYDTEGNPLGDEFRINADSAGLHFRPRIAMDGDGRFIVAFQDDDGSDGGISTRRYDAAGNAGPEFRVNTYTTGEQNAPDVADDGAGDFVIVWGDMGRHGEIYGRRYDAAGAPAGDEFHVNAYATGVQTNPAIAMVSDGRFMVAWDSYGQDGDHWGVTARRFDAAGTAQGDDQAVNVYTTNYQRAPSVAADGSGNFVVTWFSYWEDGSFSGVFALRFDPSGAPEPPFRVNTYTTEAQYGARVAAAPSGDFVVAWQSYGQDGDGYGVFAQRYSPDLIFKDGFESGTLGAWSSSATGGGRLSPSGAAALDGSSVGLQGVVTDTSPLYVEDDRPHDEERYRARFWLDPSDYDPGESQGHCRTRLFLVFEEAPMRRLAAIVLKRQGGVYGIEGRCRLDDGAQADTGFFPISGGPHAIEIDWQRATGPANGRFELFIDGVSRAVLTSLASGGHAVDLVRLGALSVKSGATGTLFWDEFESRRQGYIGP